MDVDQWESSLAISLPPERWGWPAGTGETGGRGCRSCTPRPRTGRSAGTGGHSQHWSPSASEFRVISTSSALQSTGFDRHQVPSSLIIIVTWTVFLVAAANDDSEIFLEDWNNIPPRLQATRLNIINNPGTIIQSLHTMYLYLHHQVVRQ